MVKRCNCSAMHVGPCHADILSAKLVVNLDLAGEKRTAETADGNSDRDRMGLASPAPACTCPVPPVGADLDIHTAECPRPSHWHPSDQACTDECRRIFSVLP